MVVSQSNRTNAYDGDDDDDCLSAALPLSVSLRSVCSPSSLAH